MTGTRKTPRSMPLVLEDLALEIDYLPAETLTRRYGAWRSGFRHSGATLGEAISTARAAGRGPSGTRREGS